MTAGDSKYGKRHKNSHSERDDGHSSHVESSSQYR